MGGSTETEWVPKKNDMVNIINYGDFSKFIAQIIDPISNEDGKIMIRFSFDPNRKNPKGLSEKGDYETSILREKLSKNNSILDESQQRKHNSDEYEKKPLINRDVEYTLYNTDVPEINDLNSIIYIKENGAIKINPNVKLLACKDNNKVIIDNIRLINNLNHTDIKNLKKLQVTGNFIEFFGSCDYDEK
jgi:hypothetical protein